ncbi:MFS transporter [Actinomadura viridis]|uniref:MHS family alpha-ketoglutarate permease-like MFS transporter n=1 Tax=Actinomadura viridis TaxID=58110 RepID=A0A931GMT4_9ACTN|nr:MFS transporter [Actinomadura viridis]MBG6093017.1 MHS family alpha-ketoglutarate permease-like MFS transporter [Actinomadura viridis]
MATSLSTPSGDRPARRGASKSRMFFSVNLGNALEWYDWAVFAIFAGYFAGDFFDTGNDVSNLLSVLAVFAVGFVMRPVGGIVFGRLADRRGRSLVLLVTMSLVALSSVMIAIGPTYASVGVLASVWLVVARCLQGFAHGGEMGGSYTYVAEMATPRNRGLWGSTIVMSTVTGTLLATLLGATLRVVLDERALNDWAWRIPFLLGGLLGLVALYLRRTLREPEVFTGSRRGTAPPSTRETFRNMWVERSSVLRVMVIVAGTGVFSYAWSVSAPSYATSFHGVDDGAAMWAGVGANLVFIAMLPLTAMLSDRIGRRTNFMIWGAGVAVLAFPLSGLLGPSAWALLAAMSLALAVQSFGAGIQVAWFAELFSTRSRATGVGMAASVSAAVFGGTAPYLNAWLTGKGLAHVFTWYVVVLALLGIAVATRTPETRGMELDRGEAPEGEPILAGTAPSPKIPTE